MYRDAYRFVLGVDTNTQLWGCNDGRLIGNSVLPSFADLSQRTQTNSHTWLSFCSSLICVQTTRGQRLQRPLAVLGAQ